MTKTTLNSPQQLWCYSMKRNAFLAWCEHLIQPAADAYLVDKQRGKQRDTRNLGPKLKDQCNRPDRKWRPDPLTQDAPPRPPLPPRSLPGIRAAPPRAGHDGSYSSPRYTPRAVERCGRRGADYISQQPPRGARMRSGTRVNKNLPLRSPPRERRCAQPETARGAAGPLGPSQRREAALSGRRHCLPFPSASTASGERRGGIGPCGCDAGIEGGREPLFSGTLRGREGSGDPRAVGWERPQARLWGWGGFFSSAGGGGAPHSACPPGSRCGDRRRRSPLCCRRLLLAGAGGAFTEKWSRLGAGGEGRGLYATNVGVRAHGLLGWGREDGGAPESAAQGWSSVLTASVLLRG